MNKYFFLFIAIVAIGCTSKKNAWEAKLPLHFNSKNPKGLESILPDSVRDKDETRAYLFEQGGVTAYVVIGKEFFPSIVTVGADGKQIERFQFVDQISDEGTIWASSADVTINSDKTIVKIDSTYALMGDGNGDINENIRALGVTTSTYKLADSGKFEKIDEHGL